MTTLPVERRRPAFGLPDRLLKSREVAGLEQAEIAQALDVSRQTVSNYERGITKPRRLQLREWALVCGVDLDWLQNGDTPRPQGSGGEGEPPVGIEPTTYSLLGRQPQSGARVALRPVAA